MLLKATAPLTLVLITKNQSTAESEAEAEQRINWIRDENVKMQISCGTVVRVLLRISFGRKKQHYATILTSTRSDDAYFGKNTES